MNPTQRPTASASTPSGDRILEVRSAPPQRTVQATVEVLSGGRIAPVEGLGGALNEIGARALFSLDPGAQKEVLADLFGPAGLGLSLNRLPIGASDFALDAYSLDDAAGDYDLARFSLARDETLLIPFAQAALGANPAMRFWASPWSPPAWMKTTGEMCAGGELLDDPRVRRAYARYLVRFASEYASRGVPISAVAVQNEPDVVNVYPTATMTAESMRDFLRAYLLPEFVRVMTRAMPTKVWVGTIRDVAGYAEAVFADPVVRNLVSGVGFQYSSEPTVSQAARALPGCRVYHTESPCHNGANSWDEALDIFADAALYFRSGSSNYCYWNLILDERQTSTWNWNQNSLLTIDRSTGTVKRNPEYQTLRRLREAAPDGSWTRTAKAQGVDAAAAFEGPDGRLRIALSHRGPGDREVVLTAEGSRWLVALPAGAMGVVVLD